MICGRGGDRIATGGTLSESLESQSSHDSSYQSEIEPC